MFDPSLINSFPSSVGIPFASLLVSPLKNYIRFGKAIARMPEARAFCRTTKSPLCARQLGIQRPSLMSIGCCNGLCMVFIAALVFVTIKSTRFCRLLAFNLLSKSPVYSLVSSGIQKIFLANQPQSPCPLASMSMILFISWSTQLLRIYSAIFYTTVAKLVSCGLLNGFLEFISHGGLLLLQYRSIYTNLALLPTLLKASLGSHGTQCLQLLFTALASSSTQLLLPLRWMTVWLCFVERKSINA